MSWSYIHPLPKLLAHLTWIKHIVADKIRFHSTNEWTFESAPLCLYAFHSPKGQQIYLILPILEQFTKRCSNNSKIPSHIHQMWVNRQWQLIMAHMTIILLAEANCSRLDFFFNSTKQVKLRRGMIVRMKCTYRINRGSLRLHLVLISHVF